MHFSRHSKALSNACPVAYNWARIMFFLFIKTLNMYVENTQKNLVSIDISRLFFGMGAIKTSVLPQFTTASNDVRFDL
jgi:hypothetical protein